MYEILYWQTNIILSEIYYTTSIMILLILGALNIGNIKSNTVLNNNKQEISVFSYLALQIVVISVLILLISNTNDLIINSNKYILDNISWLSNIIILIISSVYILSIKNLLKQDLRYTYEYWILILTSILGMLLLIKANDLIAMYLAIELQSMGMYVLSTYSRTSRFGTEGGLKYYVMGSISSCFQLLGIALIYGMTGVTNYTDLSILIGDLLNTENSLIVGYILVIIGLLFKLAAAPFHIWAPDVYQAAPLASTTFFSIIPKLAIIIALYRLININDLITIDNNINIILMIISGLSILIGTIQALGQSNIKRLLSYSSISHVGFIIIGLITGYITTSLFYVLIYIIMSIGIFGLLIELKTSDLTKPYYEILGLKNLSEQNKMYTLSFAIILFSMAGIPPLAGFYSKYYILIDAINSNYIILSLIAILGSAIAAYYYINIIQLFYFYKNSLTKNIYNRNESSKINTIIISISILLILIIINIESDIQLYLQYII